LEALEDRSLLSTGAGLASLAGRVEAPAGDVPGQVAPTSQAGRQLDWQVTEAGVITSRQPVENGVLLTFQAEGQAHHAGRITETGSLVQSGSNLCGTATVTVANGDQIFGVITAQIQRDGTIVGHYQFVGGTGRFAGASGHTDWVAVLDPNQVNFTVSCSGIL